MKRNIGLAALKEMKDRPSTTLGTRKIAALVRTSLSSDPSAGGERYCTYFKRPVSWRGAIFQGRRGERYSAFTLIELLLVVTIVGILAVTVSVSVNQSRIGARDTQRKADLKALEAATEQYWADRRCYPNTPTAIEGRFYIHADIIGTGGEKAPLKKALLPRYLNPIPEDPRYKLDKGNIAYQYESKDGEGTRGSNHANEDGCLGTRYRFWAFLENQNDPELTADFVENNVKFLQLASPGWVESGRPPGNF